MVNFTGGKAESVVTGASKEEIGKLGLYYPPQSDRPSKGTGASGFLPGRAHGRGGPREEGGGPTTFAAEIHDGKIYGEGRKTQSPSRGSDHRLPRPAADGAALRGDLIFSATVDDEIGAWPGMGYLLEKGFQKHGFPKPDYHVAGEPPAWNL